MRIRSTLSLLALALLAMPAATARADSTPQHSSYAALEPQPGTTFVASAVSLDSLPAFTIATALHHEAPAPSRRSPGPLSLLGFALAGATSKKSAPRRKRSGFKVPDVPMYLDSAVHVMRDDELVIISGGVLLDDTELTDEEIADIQRHGVIRPATPAELERLQEAESLAAATELAKDQEREMRQLVANQAAELSGVDEAKKPALVDKHLKQISDLQGKHATALAS